MKQPIRTVINVPTKFGGHVKVEELVYHHLDDGKNRIVWTRFPFDDTMAGGLPNPCIYVDWPTPNGANTEVQARDEVKRSFVEYYRI